jgi:general stress protein 26
MPDQLKHQVETQAFRDLVKDIPFAMFTTVTADGTLRSRPMVAHAEAYDGMLWFFTRTTSPVASEIEGNPHVNVAYVSAPEDRFVSAAGRATIVRDHAAAKRLWTGAFSKWFPGGPEDPELSLIKIELTRTEFWDAKAGRMQQL